ncbi:MAG: GxxExxY protein [Kiritimatiellae bacterium]|jgi:GxxExxY protein|nr:GxxExxY protein [Kiritimatiellia bacterium]
MTDDYLNKLTEKIIGIAIEVHRELGPGLLESVYQRCLTIALREAGLEVNEQLDVPVLFRGKIISDSGYRLDMLVENHVIVELKSTKALTDLDKKQLLTYLRLMQKRIGLLINFNSTLLKNGIKRIAN